MAMASAPSDSFRDAASYLSNATSLTKVSNSLKLELYALFKWLTVSPQPSGSRPSIFDMTGRAKWDSWSAAGKQYTSSVDAENRYLEIARDLGWQPGAPAPPENKTTGDDIWDLDSDSSKDGGGGGGGMGVSVSSIAAPEIQTDNTLHGLAITGDLNKLETLVSLDSEVDINALDEFGYTPLHLACDRGSVETVRFLLSKGADTSIKDPDEMTPLQLAQTAGHEGIVELLSNQ
ncbi:ankyrin repeat-containing domain protein [Lentinula aciculospora]|uniref:Ankyrin repeat-containing domain protein n=1 Tax=Lentinula aciculospora TaxID=153920 RepID=A0A9W9DVD1_9AGAR|nr:ankyrin repeat-containing domain protein [Lentinula aciculospora]